MKLLATTPDDRFITLEVSGDMEVKNLKALLELETGIPTNEQIVIFHSNPLTDDEKSLEAYGIANDDAIVVQSNRGQVRPTLTSQPAMPGSSPLSSIDPARFLDHLAQQDPNLAHQARQDPQVLRKLIDATVRHQKEISALEADPFNPESQKKIEEMIRQQNLERNFQEALEHNPETFGNITMLYVTCEVNKCPVKAFVDSGAQTSIMSENFSKQSGLEHLVDGRFQGVAQGVGTSKILGRIHRTHLVLGGQHLVCSFNVLDMKDIDIIIGLDMLRRHQASIDLKRNALVINDVATPFLPEHEVPKPSAQSLAQSSAAASSQASVSAAAASPTSSTPTSKPVGNPSSSPSKYSEATIATLMGLGVSRKEAIQALDMANGNPDMAAGFLF
ncbi:DNA damage-inducible protein 1 [Dispira parvispora]|uniref:DNA damage-inducible protein 1 n=1 Tax=Dispira parvispora TaxID=1520584 RepID=A0A9W8AP49_9FUNG|nr:DNA damage-inducible protein 1 [Dispira parvispora]